ncbi:hypothetical protein B0H14DRAFT_3051183, partial [Mycena olivaceomarginata]
FRLTLIYVLMAFLTIMSYDALLNAGEEYHHIWKSKWSLIKCLYLWSRYGPFIDTTISVLRGGGVISDLLHGVSLTQTLTNCNTLNKFNTVFSIFGIGVTEVRKKCWLFCVVVWLSQTSIVSNCTFFSFCDLVEGSSVLVACYVSLLVGETVIVLLTLWKFVHYKVSAVAGTFRSSRLIISFYRDGIIFYMAILAIFIGIMVLQRGLPTEFKLIGLTPLRVMHSILTCQLVIHVRVVASEEDTGTGMKEKSLLFADLQADSRCGIDTVI